MPVTENVQREWREYRGPENAPADFDAFWQEQIRGIQEEDCPVELMEAEVSIPGADCYWMKLTPKGDCEAELYGKLLVPRDRKPEGYPVSLVFHDYPEASPSWFHLARYLALGMMVVAPDCVDQAGKSRRGYIGRGTGAYGPLFMDLEDTLENMYLCQIYKDGIRWTEAVKKLEFCDPNRVHLYGAGLGGALALVGAYADPSVVTCGLHYPMLCDFPKVWELDYMQSGYMGLHYYFRWHDPLHEHGQKVFDRLAYFDICHIADRVQTDCILSTGLADLVSPPMAQFALANRLGGHVRHLVYPKHGHELNNFFENEYLRFLIEHL